jgi:hypothetical protein
MVPVTTNHHIDILFDGLGALPKTRKKNRGHVG